MLVLLLKKIGIDNWDWLSTIIRLTQRFFERGNIMSRKEMKMQQQERGGLSERWRGL